MKYIVVIMLVALSAWGQPTQQVVVNPDCIVPFQFTAAGQVSPTNGFNNKQVGCNVWEVQYAANGFAALSLVLQSAPDNNGVAGAFTTMGGTVSQGVNPNTNTTGASTVVTTFGTAFSPWVRMTLASVTGSGSVVGVAVGFRLPNSSGSVTVVIPGTVNTNLIQVASSAVVTGGVAGLLAVGGAAADGAAAAGNPVLIGGHDSAGTPLAHVIQTDTFGGILPSGVTAPLADGISNTETVPAFAQAGASVAGTVRNMDYEFNGSTWDRRAGCSRATPVITNLAGSGNTQIFAGTAAQNIYICDIEFSTGVAEDFKLTEGTGANCVTGTADASALMKNILAWSLTPAGGRASRITQTAGDSLCANQANTQAAGVTVWAIKF